MIYFRRHENDDIADQDKTRVDSGMSESFLPINPFFYVVL
jgi:hypothetical protein